MYLIAVMNSSIPMNELAGMLPSAYGEQAPPLLLQAASGSGKTRPSSWYEPSSEAVGAAMAGTANTRRAAAAATAANSRIEIRTPGWNQKPERSLTTPFPQCAG